MVLTLAGMEASETKIKQFSVCFNSVMAKWNENLENGSQMNGTIATVSELNTQKN